MTPQITMAILIAWTTFAFFRNMLKNDKNKTEITVSFVASLSRAATLIAVLWWGGFWN
jgi:hypothetical protein